MMREMRSMRCDATRHAPDTVLYTEASRSECRALFSHPRCMNVAGADWPDRHMLGRGRSWHVMIPDHPSAGDTAPAMGLGGSDGESGRRIRD